MRLTEKNRRYILVGMVAFIIIGIFTAKILGSKQDEQFMYEDMLYAQANQMYQDGNYIDAMTYSNELLKLQPNSEDANYLGALIATQTGEYKQSAILLQKTVDINPHRVEDALFLIQYGEILIQLERYVDARKLLNQSLGFTWQFEEDEQQYIEYIGSLLEQIVEGENL